MSSSLPIHGRGAPSNPANRFDRIDVVLDPDAEIDPAELPAPKTIYLRDTSRSIIATNDSPDVMIEASINPYRGCEHGCIYCLSGDTLILMADATAKTLKDVRVGDAIYGTERRGWYRRYVRTTVLAHWQTTQPAYRVTLENGTSIVTGPNHRFLTDRGWKYVTPSPKRQRPFLTPNNKLMGMSGFARGIEACENYRRGYLCGLVRGDGLLASYQYQRAGRSNGDQHQFRLALADQPALDRARAFLSDLGVPTREIPFGPVKDGFRPMRAIRTHARAAVDRVREICDWPRNSSAVSSAWGAGFLAGIYDAEGCYSQGVLRISNTDGVIIDRIAACLRSLRFAYTLETVTRTTAKSVHVVRIRGGLGEHMRFFQNIDPAIRRKCDIEQTAVKSQERLRVISVEPLRKRIRMFDLTTGTGDFIANGVVSHNCYARPTHEYFGLSAGLDFETQIFVKEQAPELLRAELMARKWTPKVVSISGVTDCYQPIERKLAITRRCLQVLAEFKNPCGVITKNHLVTRDIDVLRELAEQNLVVAILSITTLDPEVQRVMEPRTSTPNRRLEAIRVLADSGIRAGVMVAPVIPGLTDHEMPAILNAAAQAGAKFAGYVPVRLPFAVKDLFEQWLEEHFPDRKKKILSRIRDMRGGKLNDSNFYSRMSGEGPMAEQLSQMFDLAKRRAGITEKFPPLNRDLFRRPSATHQPGSHQQLALFE